MHTENDAKYLAACQLLEVVQGARNHRRDFRISKRIARNASEMAEKSTKVSILQILEILTAQATQKFLSQAGLQ